jgi:hypothetical protein
VALLASRQSKRRVVKLYREEKSPTPFLAARSVNWTEAIFGRCAFDGAGLMPSDYQSPAGKAKWSEPSGYAGETLADFTARREVVHSRTVAKERW